MSPRPRFSIIAAALFVLLLSSPQQLLAEDEQAAVAWLVTYGPGEVYYERFGHNALWLKNPARGLDHIFNFGFFDFNQPNFLGRFLRGDTLYFAAARSPEAEFSEYIATNRSISLQKLKLNSSQYQRMENYLVEQVQPSERDYRYQYFRNNCSTRVRDALDLALAGNLQQTLHKLPAAVDIRKQIHTAAAGDPWLYLGMDIAMGPSLDQTQNQWQAAFIPEVLATALTQLPDIAGERIVYYQASGDTQAERPLRYLVIASILLTGFMLLLARPWKNTSRKSQRLVATAWLVFCSLSGSFLLWLWLATTHTDAINNWNIVLLNPLYIPAMLWLRNRPFALRYLSVLVATSTLMAVLGASLSGQDMLAPMVFFGLPQLTVMLLLWNAAAKTD